MPAPLLTPPPQLNLPPAQLTLRPAAKGVEVRDILRDKWVLLTPEEWVRQHFVHFLTHTLGYPAAMMANEVGITLNSTSRRCDTVVYARDLTPLMIVEYKAPTVRIDRKVFDQIVRYNIVLQVPYLLVSNGMEHYCFRVNRTTRRCTPLQSVPAYDSLMPEP
ncbi:MAG: type I restriction enzyme HsdR N-terminal domain-containing protein [Duncaniella sp.]|nr:type I restriction enzyme HsdR N-terminal domain-containing protein [Duncaniella sp.]